MPPSPAKSPSLSNLAEVALESEAESEGEQERGVQSSGTPVVEGAQVDAAVLYDRPTPRGKTRTYSEVRPSPLATLELAGLTRRAERWDPDHHETEERRANRVQ